jgi:hypothetical protein
MSTRSPEPARSSVPPGMLGEHTARFDSVDSQLRSLTRLVGQVLDRLPEEPGDTRS